MSSGPSPNYDRTLLAQTPALTKAQRQGGYDHILLEPNRRVKRTPELALKETSTAPEFDATNTAELRKNPDGFWSRWWRPLVGAAITLVVIGAIVGGAVGATVHKGKSGSKAEGTSTFSAVGIGTDSPESGQSIIFTAPSAPDASGGTTLSLDASVSATQPAPSPNVFVPRTAHHFSAA
ncbi:hypothetical protein K438DRAFT_1977492 [Mycena galopus ATCC 62051]|nr:hypothetical protein K438DRAFT_1977492 [Mycena galopus ATCC 62051]